jgi:hypothetical protein
MGTDAIICACLQIKRMHSHVQATVRSVMQPLTTDSLGPAVCISCHQCGVMSYPHSQPLHSQHSKFACRQSACSPEFTFELSSVRPVHIRPQQLPLPCMRQISQHCRGMRSTRWHYGCHSTSVSSMPSDVVSPSKLYVPPLWIGSHGGPRMSRSDSERRFTAAGRNSNWQSRSARA